MIAVIGLILFVFGILAGRVLVALDPLWSFRPVKPRDMWCFVPTWVGIFMTGAGLLRLAWKWLPW